MLKVTMSLLIVIFGDFELGVLAHAYNPSYLAGRDGEDQGSRPVWAKKLARSLSQ
jgi:hypothetical protein